ncbi:DUF6174 domain-containing protein [Candidatus Uabimicrobium sp. HlEnr_7]|uniref:DUF6174 domain-containing protein n=1 Tax=Candidatus Uabimicrobium helgolandensis TaxID=3095367 RepID=UPI003557586D
MKNLVILCILVVLVFHSVSAQSNNEQVNKVTTQFLKWKQHKVQNYQFTFHRNYMEMPFEKYALPKRINVEQDKVVKVTFTDSKFDAKYGKAPVPSVNTLDAVFALVAKAIKEKADKIDVKYDAKYGFPKSVFIDWETDRADEEDSIEILDFTPTTVTEVNVEGVLSKNLLLWKQQKIQNYQFTFHRNYMEMPFEKYALPKRVSVKKGKVVKVTFTDSKFDDKYGKAPTPQINTVDVTFALVAKAIKEKADKIDVKYDAKYGFPKSVFIDWDTDRADEEDSIEILDFVTNN